MNDACLKELVEKYSTPLYVYDFQRLLKQYGSIREALPASFNLFYSMKANPLLGIGALFQKLGCGVEIASGGELYAALMAGFQPENIIFTSPGKTDEELKYAISEDIFCINIESIEEAVMIDRIARAQAKTVNIAIRINPNFNYLTTGLTMTGIPSQFGIEKAQLKEAYCVINKLNHVKPIGVSVYMGTQALEAENIILNTKEIIKLALEVADDFGFKLKYLNLGGGFGIPYFANDRSLDMDELSKGMKMLWFHYREELKDTRIIAESGRFLIADSGCYLTKILYRKKSKGNSYLICDGGSNHHGTAAFLGRYIRDNFPIRILSKDGQGEEVTITGPLCTPVDVIGQKVKVPHNTMPGDIVIIEKAGAYGLTNSPVLFLSHAIPKEVMVKDGKSFVLRERWEPKEFFKGQQKDFD